MGTDPYALQKYEELYKLTKEGLQEELSRSSRLDEKASRYLGFLSVVFGAGAIVGPSFVQSLRPIQGFWDWAALALSALLLAAVFRSAWLTLRVLKIQRWLTFPLDEEMQRYFVGNLYLNVLYSLARENIVAVTTNREVATQKAMTLQKAYRLLNLALVFAVLVVVASTVAVALAPQAAAP